MEEQLKRLTDHYLPLIESTESSEDMQSVKFTFLRELLLLSKDTLDFNDANDTASQILDFIIELVSEEEGGKGKLPIDTIIVEKLGLTIEDCLKRHRNWKALDLFYILIVNYPKVVMNMKHLARIMSRIILIRINKDESALNNEYLDRIIDFYSSYCLEFNDQYKMFCSNVKELLPAIMESLSQEKTKNQFLHKTLQSLILIPLAKDMCQVAYANNDFSEAPL